MYHLPPITTLNTVTGLVPLQFLPPLAVSRDPTTTPDGLIVTPSQPPAQPSLVPPTLWDRLRVLASSLYETGRGALSTLGDYAADLSEFGASRTIQYLPRIAGGLPSTVPTFQHPLLDARVSSSFGWRLHPIHHQRLFHDGLDLVAPYGSMVRAAAAGKVRLLPERVSGGYGNLVIIDHGNGYATRYGHTSRFLVKNGDWVTAGQSIARVGSTGVSTGPHLHFEVRYRGAAQDPRRFLPA